MTISSPHSTRSGRGLTVADAMVAYDYQIADDNTVDQANDIFRSAHVEYLLVRGHDGRCEGLVTRTGLNRFLTRCWYADRTAISSTAHQRGPFTWPNMALTLAALAMRIRHLAVWPVVDDDGYLVGVLTADRAAAVLAAHPA